MIDSIAAWVRRCLLAAAANVSLFVTTSFFVTGLLIQGPSFWWRGYVDLFESYVLIPWGMALCLLRLERRTREHCAHMRWDLNVLFVLLAWLIVPFAFRFGATFNNVGSWHNHTVLFFGVYALTAEESAHRREKLFDLAALLFSLSALALGAALMYCVITVQQFGDAQFAFGVCEGIYLCANGHYNTTGMVAVCSALMSLAGAARFRKTPLRALCLVSVALMTVTAVLTQSRTARYSLIAGYALLVYGGLCGRLKVKRAFLRHAAAIAAACAVAAAGYAGAGLITDAAIAHYNRAQQDAVEASVIPAAMAEERNAAGEQEKAAAPEEAVQTEYQTREAVDSSFSGRTGIWRNLIQRWKDDPKYLLIGHGIGRIGGMVTENTIHEGREGVSIHNTYLQFMADYGLVGFGLLCVFFALIAAPVARVFFARGAQATPGYRSLCAMAAASLLTGMMESAPLGAMTPMNTALFFALALLASAGREMENPK
ncbi:MAG: O-antigen ligase family protein [Clostridia bacterium]|nr:O-antigen ligase family protein [Clostridia bacterium]